MFLDKFNPFKSNKSSKPEPPKEGLKSDLKPSASANVHPVRSAASVAESVKSATKKLGYKATHQEPPNTMFIDKNKVSANRMPNVVSGGMNPLAPAMSTSSIR